MRTGAAMEANMMVFMVMVLVLAIAAATQAVQAQNINLPSPSPPSSPISQTKTPHLVQSHLPYNPIPSTPPLPLVNHLGILIPPGTPLPPLGNDEDNDPSTRIPPSPTGTDDVPPAPPAPGASSATIQQGICVGSCTFKCRDKQGSRSNTKSKNINRGIGRGRPSPRRGKALPHPGPAVRPFPIPRRRLPHPGFSLCFVFCMAKCYVQMPQKYLYQCTAGCAYNSITTAHLTDLHSGTDKLDKYVGSCYDKCKKNSQAFDTIMD